MRLVTSFGDHGYDVYGEKFLKSYHQHCDLPLTVYYEVKRSFPKAKRMEYKPLSDVPGLVEFLSDPVVATNGGKDPKDYRFQINRFCRKAFVQFHELEKGGKFAWIDADVEFKGKADSVKIKNTIKDTYVAYMGRENFHPCTSFLGFDCNHADHDKFLEAYRHIYLSKEVFKLTEWHDAFVFNHVRLQTGVKSKNLCDGIMKAVGSRNVFDMVFPFARHKKGNRKYEWCKKE